MSDYSSTFTESTGDTIDATDFSTEFTAIESAVATKVDDGGTATDMTLDGTLVGTALGRGALVTLSADESIPNATSTHISWDSETGGYDTDSIHDNATNNKRLTVPASVTKVRISAQVVWESNAGATDYRRLHISKNDETTTPTIPIGCPSDHTYGTGGVDTQCVTSSILTVVAGDYFTCCVNQQSGGALNVDASSTFGESWFAMEIIK